MSKLPDTFEIVCLVLDLAPYRLRIAYRHIAGERIGSSGEVLLWETDLNIPGTKPSAIHQTMPPEIQKCLREVLAHAKFVVRMALEQG